MDNQFFWCQRHRRVEHEDNKCGALNRLGPYSTEEAARNWRETAEARNDKWEEEDKEWEGED